MSEQQGQRKERGIGRIMALLAAAGAAVAALAFWRRRKASGGS
jgi:hypothetical protein